MYSRFMLALLCLCLIYISPAKSTHIFEKKIELEDQLEALLIREIKYYPLRSGYTFKEKEYNSLSFRSVVDHYFQSDKYNKSNKITLKYREEIIEWYVKIINYLNLNDSVIFFAIDYLDRYYCLISEEDGKNISEQKYQIFAITSFYMAYKIHNYEALSIRLIEGISRGLVNSEIIERTERSILKRIDWRVNPPTANLFAYYITSLYLKDYFSKEIIRELSKKSYKYLYLFSYLYSNMNYKQSDRAILSIIYALNQVSNNKSLNNDCIKYICYKLGVNFKNINYIYSSLKIEEMNH